MTEFKFNLGGFDSQADVDYPPQAEPHVHAAHSTPPPPRPHQYQHIGHAVFGQDFLSIDERDETQVTLQTLEVPRWMAGRWRDEPGGWRDAKANNEFFSFEKMRTLIAARVTELGLDEALVRAYPHSVQSPDFSRLSFEDRMEILRK